MNRDSYLAVALAICCIGAAGVSSTTLDSTLTQRPDDVVDIDFAKLPIGEDAGVAAEGALESDGNKKVVKGKEGDGDAEQERQKASEKEGDEAPENKDKQGQESGSDENSGSESSASKDSGAQGGEGDGKGTGTGGEPSLLDRILDLLMALLPLLLLLLLLALVYRYRYHLLALGLAIKSVLVGDDAESTAGSTAWPSESPNNEVHRAWLSMVAATGIDDPHRRTPSECAAAAIEEGHDPGAVETLTETFEEVRYGGKPVTDDRRERARKGLDRIGGGGAV